MTEQPPPSDPVLAYYNEDFLDSDDGRPHYFFTRKLWFAHLARAMVAFPGSLGTLDELPDEPCTRHGADDCHGAGEPRRDP